MRQNPEYIIRHLRGIMRFLKHQIYKKWYDVQALFVKNQISNQIDRISDEESEKKGGEHTKSKEIA